MINPLSIKPAFAAQRAAFKGAQGLFKTTTGSAREAWRAGTLPRADYLKTFRAAAKTQNATLKAARATRRTAMSLPPPSSR